MFATVSIKNVKEQEENRQFEFWNCAKNLATDGFENSTTLIRCYRNVRTAKIFFPPPNSFSIRIPTLIVFILWQ